MPVPCTRRSWLQGLAAALAALLWPRLAPAAAPVPASQAGGVCHATLSIDCATGTGVETVYHYDPDGRLLRVVTTQSYHPPQQLSGGPSVGAACPPLDECGAARTDPNCYGYHAAFPSEQRAFLSFPERKPS
jgi:hypothetical protein